MPADQLSRTFAALADPTRRDLVARLTLGDATLTELAAPYAMSRQAEARYQRLDAVLADLSATPSDAPRVLSEPSSSSTHTPARRAR